MKIKNKHKPRFIAMGYAAAIIFAFVLSTTTNNNVIASVSSDSIEYINMLDKENEEIVLMNINNNYVDNEFGILDNLKVLMKSDNVKEKSNKFESQKTEELVRKTIEIGKGDNFIGILTQKVGLGYNEATTVINSLKKKYNPKNIRVGQVIEFEVLEKAENNELISLEKIIITQGHSKRIILKKVSETEYKTSVEEDELLEEVVSSSGQIRGSLSGAMNANGIPNSVVANFINIFSYSVDFRKDVRSGDRYELIYENKVNKDGKVVKTGDILYAALKLHNDILELYRFENPKGGADYYNEKGIALKRTLHRKPLAFQNARISSPFGRRRHPVFKDTRIHWGVDYAAPRGTAIFAAGDGVVQVAKYNGGYGNYIKIRHNSEYSTAYGHMNSFAKGMKSGVRVKQGQIIGYVGNTGRSTGPHLHYEVVRNGKRVNPTAIKAATGENLNRNALANFKKVVSALKAEHKTFFANKDKKEQKSAKR
ncbi:MAG: M23 family metallopeptidase [Alphaproteobacteria bacterium]|nr:M23 family metallopeptidase [Alphaproteobacteria bacterium]